jgi:hypothetical protein
MFSIDAGRRNLALMLQKFLRLRAALGPIPDAPLFLPGH